MRYPLSPTLRGVSFPPTPNKSLKRGVAIQHPTLRGTVLTVVEPGREGGPAGPGGEGHPNITVIADTGDDELEESLDSDTRLKRLARSDRPDTRRYHTAGTIEDLRVSTRSPADH